MNILVVGCGRVGSKLAMELYRRGHEVMIVDQNEKSFDLLDDFDGYTIAGVPIDTDVLLQAGIENCDGLIAVCADDNMNIMVAQMAKEIFGVQNVIARIYDPKREEAFTHSGINTICPTNSTVSDICIALTEKVEFTHLTFGTNNVCFTYSKPKKDEIGEKLINIKRNEDEIVFGVLHKENKFIMASRNMKYEILSTDRIVVSKIVD